MDTFGIIKAGGGAVVAAGSFDQLTVAGGTACHLGRTLEDPLLISCYFVKIGAMSAPVNGKEVKGGRSLLLLIQRSFANFAFRILYCTLPSTVQALFQVFITFSNHSQDS